MVWAFVIVVLLLLVFSAGFRKFALILLAVCVIGGYVYYQNEKKEERLSKTRIPLSDLVFDNLVLKSSYGGYDLVGRIINNSSKYTLTGILFKLTFRDCDLKDESNCIVIAEEDEYIYITIPPKQAREFKGSIYLPSNFKVKGKLVWSYRVEYTKGKERG